MTGEQRPHLAEIVLQVFILVVVGSVIGTAIAMCYALFVAGPQ